ncbi:MAG: DUF7305 domain-containing protein, partial [Planctomycetota bacterium]
MRPVKKLKRSAKSGLALLLALAALVLLLALGGGFLSLGLHGRVLTIREGQDIKAQRAADAGLAKAIFEMNRMLEARVLDDALLNSTEAAPIGPGGETTSYDPKMDPAESGHYSLPHAMDARLPNCDATYSYKVTPTSEGAAVGFTIACVGKSGTVTKTVYADLGLKGLFDSALLVQDRISLMPNTLVKGYNSADPLDKDVDLTIGTTSVEADRIPLGPGTVVDGDVFVGVGGDPDVVIGAGGTITGQKYPLLVEPEFPVITAPALPKAGTGLSAKGSTVTLGPAESGQYTDIILAQGAGSAGILEISGGDVVLHITGNIDLGAGCELVVTPGASLTLYVDGDISADNSVGFNNNAGNVEDFKLYATGTGTQVFDLKAKSSIFGAVYAPDVDINMYPGSEVHGAIVGNSVVFKSGGTFY